MLSTCLCACFVLVWLDCCLTSQTQPTPLQIALNIDSRVVCDYYTSSTVNVTIDWTMVYNLCEGYVWLARLGGRIWLVRLTRLMVLVDVLTCSLVMSSVDMPSMIAVALAAFPLPFPFPFPLPFFLPFGWRIQQNKRNERDACNLMNVSYHDLFALWLSLVDKFSVSVCSSRVCC